jgi:hypothetical protein
VDEGGVSSPLEYDGESQATVFYEEVDLAVVEFHVALEPRLRVAEPLGKKPPGFGHRLSVGWA